MTLPKGKPGCEKLKHGGETRALKTHWPPFAQGRSSKNALFLLPQGLPGPHSCCFISENLPLASESALKTSP